MIHYFNISKTVSGVIASLLAPALAAKLHLRAAKHLGMLQALSKPGAAGA